MPQQNRRLHPQPAGDVATIASNTDSFLHYTNRWLDFSPDFVAVDSASNRLTKAAFLQSLQQGGWFPLRLVPADTTTYQLQVMPRGADPMIPELVKNSAALALQHYRMEGKPLPGFDYTDLEGRRYTPQNTAGKIVVLKTWFIKCKQCIAEMPELNRMAAAYRNRTDIVFLSLAFDPPDQLRRFLTTTAFSYATAAVPQAYLIDTLGILQYPTHLLINRHGLVIKVVNTASEISDYLQQESNKK